MNWTRQQIKSNARLMVRKNWLMCIAVSLVVALFAGSSGFSANLNLDGDTTAQMASNVGGNWSYWIMTFLPFLAGAAAIVAVLSILAAIFIGNPVTVGGARFYLHNIHSKGELGDLGFAFRNQYSNVVKVMLMRDIYIILWTLLLIIPGIIKSYEYFLVPYLLADNPELDTKEALQLSKAMMNGEKMNAFVLQLSFILWNLLSSMTLGIAGVVWVNPYIDASNAELYTAIKTRWEDRGYGDGTY